MYIYIYIYKINAEEIHDPHILVTTYLGPAAAICWHLLHSYWLILACVRARGKYLPGIKNCSVWWQTTVMESVFLNRSASTAHKKVRIKRQESDFQKPLKTEPRRPAEPRGAKWHQQLAATRAFHVPFTFLCLHALHDSQHEEVQLSPDCQSHSSQLHKKKMSSVKILGFSHRVQPSPAVAMDWSMHSITSTICASVFGHALKKTREAKRKKQT